MAIAPTDIIKSAKLQDGETFVLPPGATLIGASDQGLLESTCEIPLLETLDCYLALLGGTDTDSAEDTYWEPDSMARVIGYELNGVRTLFASPVGGANGCYDGPGIITQLQAALPAIIAVDSSANNESGPIGDVGSCLSYILIQTIPSVANNLKLVVTSDGTISNGTSKVEMLAKFRLYSEVQAEGYEDLPVSPCVEV